MEEEFGDRGVIYLVGDHLFCEVFGCGGIQSGQIFDPDWNP